MRLVMTGLLVACVAAVLPLAAQPQAVTVTLRNLQGESVGTATLSPASDGGVSIALDLKGLPPGEHAFHVHQVAKCEPPFLTAGPHFNPDKKMHGMDNPMGAHAGDMNNITVGADGTSRVTIVNAQVTLGEGGHSVFAGGGTSLVIHAAADDMKSDPAGNAGARIACGVVAR
jgi:superoxide dismutase, Cu-Zn family